MGTLQSIWVQNFRSVTDDGGTELHEDITVLIGANEAGKSNILKAVSRLDAEYPIPPSDIPDQKNGIDYNKSIAPVLVIQLRNDSLSEFSWLAEPKSANELNYYKKHKESDPELEISNRIRDHNIYIVQYASGDKRLHISENDEKVFSSESGPFDVIGLRDNRLEEVKDLAIGFLNDTLDDEAVETNIKDEEMDLGPDDEMSPVEVRDLLEKAFYLNEGKEIETFQPINEEGIDDEGVTPDPENVPSVSELEADAELLATGLSQLSVDTEVEKELPNVIDHTDISLLDTSVDISKPELPRPYRGLLKLGGIDVEEYDSYDSLKKDVKEACRELSRYLNGFWAVTETPRPELEDLRTTKEKEDEEFEVIADVDGTNIELQLQDETGAKIPVDERSAGMRWVLTFLLSVVARSNETDRSSIVLMDDPGIHLHPESQKRLHRSLETTGDDIQILYSTHSPALIDQRQPTQLRIVTKSSDEGTVTSRLVDARDDDDIDLLRPVRDAIGLYLSDSLFGNEYNVAVEGVSDRTYLERFNSIFRVTEDRQHLGGDFSFVVGEGDRIQYLARLFEAEEMKFVVLRDEDAQYWYDDTEEFDSDDSISLNSIDNIESNNEYDIEIEDLIEDELLAKVVSDENPDAITESELSSALSSRDKRAISCLKQKLDELCGRNQLDNRWLDKGELAEKVVEEVEQSIRDDSSRYEDTIENFEAIISEIFCYFDNNT